MDFRVINVAANTFNDARTSYRLKSIGGYSAVKMRRYQDLIDAHISRNNMQVLNMLNTKYFITRNGVQLNPQAFGNAWLVDDITFVDTPDEESQALWNLDLRNHATDNIQMKAYAPNRLDYTTSLAKPRVAVFSEIYYPFDWHLYCDGEELPIGRVNYTLRAALIPAGEHKLYMVFTPSALKTDNWCVILIVLILLISLGLATYPLWKKGLSLRCA